MARYINFSNHELPVKLAAHAIGMDHKKTYTTRGKEYYRPYRNYYTCAASTGPSPAVAAWMGLVNKGYATHCRTTGGGHRFELTRAGLDWLGIVLGVIIHDEEE